MFLLLRSNIQNLQLHANKYDVKAVMSEESLGGSDCSIFQSDADIDHKGMSILQSQRSR